MIEGRKVTDDAWLWVPEVAKRLGVKPKELDHILRTHGVGRSFDGTGGKVIVTTSAARALLVRLNHPSIRADLALGKTSRKESG